MPKERVQITTYVDRIREQQKKKLHVFMVRTCFWGAFMDSLTELEYAGETARLRHKYPAAFASAYRRVISNGVDKDKASIDCALENRFCHVENI